MFNSCVETKIAEGRVEGEWDPTHCVGFYKIFLDNAMIKTESGSEKQS